MKLSNVRLKLALSQAAACDGIIYQVNNGDPCREPEETVYDYFKTKTKIYKYIQTKDDCEFSDFPSFYSFCEENECYLILLSTNRALSDDEVICETIPENKTSQETLQRLHDIKFTEFRKEQ